MKLSVALSRAFVVLLALSAAHYAQLLPASTDSLRSAASWSLSNASRDASARTVAMPPPPPLLHGRARMLHAPTPCDVPTFAPGGPGAPYFVAAGVPRANRPFVVEWTTKPTAPAAMPAMPAMLFVSFERLAPTPMAGLGAPGCHLMVSPEFIMVPRPGSILTQAGGRIRLDWTPQISVIGEEFYAQLFVHAPGVNAGGFLLSPALHVQVGS